MFKYGVDKFKDKFYYGKSPVDHTVVVICHGASELLELTLESICNNSSTLFETIIIADNATWQTHKLLQDYGLLYVSTHFGHVFRAYREGLNRSSNEYVTFIHEDHYMGPDWDKAIQIHFKPFRYVDLFVVHGGQGPEHQPKCGYSSDLLGITKYGGFNPREFDSFIRANRMYKGMAWSFNYFEQFPGTLPKTMYNMYGGIVEHLPQAYGAEIKHLERCKQIPEYSHITSFESRIFHFGSVGRMDKTNNSFTHRSMLTNIERWNNPCAPSILHGYIKCEQCNTGLRKGMCYTTENTSIDRFIMKHGYWLCEKHGGIGPDIEELKKTMSEEEISQYIVDNYKQIDDGS